MSKVKKWLENYWYHYKWHTIVGAFLIAVVTYLIVQALTATTPQFQIMYAGPKALDMPTKIQLAEPFAQLQGPVEEEEDRVAFASIYLLTDEQAKDVLMTGFTVTDLQTNRQQFNTYTATGECLIYLLDPAWYPQLRDAGALVPLSEAMGYTPQNAIDSYGIRFKDTAFAQYFADQFTVLPDDTILCMRKFSTVMSVKGEKNQQARYQAAFDFYKKILLFGQ